MKTPANPAQSAFSKWLMQNSHELAWTALLAVVAIAVGIFMTP